MTYTELLDIGSKVKILENAQESIQSLEADISTWLQRGVSWIETEKTQPYLEIRQLLDDAIAELYRRCLVIASNGQEKISESAPTSVQVATHSSKDNNDFQQIMETVNELTAKYTSQSKLLKIFQKQLKDNEKQLDQETKNNNTQFEEKMKELHSASEFVSNLSEELNQTKESHKVHNKKIQKMSKQMEEILEQKTIQASSGESWTPQDIGINQQKTDEGTLSESLEILNESLAKMKMENELNLIEEEILKLNKEKGALIERLETLNDSMANMKMENDNLKREINLKEQEILKLNEEKASYNDRRATQDCEINRLKTMEGALNERLETLNGSIVSMKMENDNLKLQLNLKEAEIIKLKKEKESEQQLAVSLKNENIRLQNSIGLKTMQNEMLNEEISNLQNDLECGQEHTEELNDEIMSLKNELGSREKWLQSNGVSFQNIKHYIANTWFNVPDPNEYIQSNCGHAIKIDKPYTQFQDGPPMCIMCWKRGLLNNIPQ